MLPFAVSVFRISSPVGGVLGAFFIARLYGIDLSPVQMATVAILVVAMSLGGVGLPGGSSFFVVYVPVFLAVGLPVEGVAVLLALDSIPDVFRTMTNVTADMAAATVLARHSGARIPEAAPTGGSVPVPVGPAQALP